MRFYRPVFFLKQLSLVPICMHGNDELYWIFVELFVFVFESQAYTPTGSRGAQFNPRRRVDSDSEELIYRCFKEQNYLYEDNPTYIDSGFELPNDIWFMFEKPRRSSTMSRQNSQLFQSMSFGTRTWVTEDKKISWYSPKKNAQTTMMK